MTRFAVTVTIIEVILTLAASLLITATELPDPFLTETDLDDLRLSYKEYQTWKSSRFRTLIRYNTEVELVDPSRQLYTSYRNNDSDVDYELRMNRERNTLGESTHGKDVLVEENLPGQPGYMVRDYEEDSIRIEIVRARGNDLLIVRMVQEGVRGAGARRAMANSERHARKVQMRLLDRMKWR